MTRRRPAHVRPRSSTRRLFRLATSLILVGLVIAVVVAATSGGHSRRNAAGGHPTTTIAPATTSTSLAGSAPGWVAAENALAGTSAWTLDGAGTHPANKGEIAGYLGRVSAQQGDTVPLFVSTAAAHWSVVAYRMGWYGGTLARQVWTSPTEIGQVQTAPTRVAGINMVDTAWVPSLQLTIGADWPPGDYLLKLIASTGAASYVPLTVRNDASRAPILIVNAVTTWQAYNLWGGADLYSGTGGRSDEVTFDRPYQLGTGSGDFLGNEEKLVKLVEGAGLDVSYSTDVDLEQHPALLTQHRVLVSLGHDEYWSTGMRAAVESARGAGVNLVFLGANAVFRHIRFATSPLGADRREINYRVAGLDPLNGKDDAEVTVQWRDPPVNRPEATLLGEMYECNPVLADFVVTDPTAWIYAGTGLTAGDRLPGLVGSEYDHWTPGAGPAVQDMAHSPVTCRGRASTSDFTYYVAPSGAGVLDTGTNLWVPRIGDGTRVGTAVDAITLTILRAAALGPLGSTHPEVPSRGAGITTATLPPPAE